MSPKRERGIILLAAMVAAIALAFSGIALVRAVANAVAIDGNLTARRHAMVAASVGVEQAVATLFGPGAVDATVDDLGRSYFAARRAGEDPRGVPIALQTIAAYPAESPVIDAGEGYEARLAIERMCAAPGAASAGNCSLSPPSVEAASGAPPPGEPPRVPYFRISVRVDGPAAAATFVQATVCAANANPRFAWRMLDE